jgi:hypothetical protein
VEVTWLKKSSSGGRKSVPRRHRKVIKSSVLGRSPFCRTRGPEELEELEEPLSAVLAALERTSLSGLT